MDYDNFEAWVNLEAHDSALFQAMHTTPVDTNTIIGEENAKKVDEATKPNKIHNCKICFRPYITECETFICIDCLLNDFI